MQTDILIIGAGVIGLSIGLFFSKSGYDVVILEKDKSFGLSTSSRNTEVIHAGIYYKKDSLKQKLCLKGKSMLYDFCDKYSIKYNKCGKIFIANSSQELTILENLKNYSVNNGLKDLIFLNRNEISNKEPLLEAKYGLLSPSSGIFDSYELMSKLSELNNNHGTSIAYVSPFVNAKKIINDHWEIDVGGKEPSKIKSKLIINSSGLDSTSIRSKIFPNMSNPISLPVKGSYLRYSGNSPFKHIIYPCLIPGKISERVDATPDLNNSLLFGPSIEKYISGLDYSSPHDLIDRLYPSIIKYFPTVELAKINRDQSGYRPKIKSKNLFNDYFIKYDHNNNWIDLIGIESPALTSCLAIGEYVFHLYSKK